MDALNQDYPDTMHDMPLVPPTNIASSSVFGAPIPLPAAIAHGTGLAGPSALAPGRNRPFGTADSSDDDDSGSSSGSDDSDQADDSSSSKGQQQNTNSKKAQKQKKQDKPFNITSEEAFPALSSAGTRAPVLSAWSNRPAMAATKPVVPAKSQLAFDVLVAHMENDMVPRPSAPPALQKVLKSVMTRTKTQLSFNAKPTLVTFLIRGAKDQCESAKREIIASVAKKITATIAIPVSMRGVVVGAKGKNVKALQEKTMTRITLPPQDPNAAEAEAKQERPFDDFNNDEDEEEEVPTVDITVSGDVQGVELVRKEINAIVGEKMSKAKARLPSSRIPATFYPLIRGARDSRLNELQNKLEVKINIPPIYTSSEERENDTTNGTDAKKPPPYDGLIITGDREKVRAAVEHIETLVEEMSRTTKSLQVSIPKRQRKFLIGPKGAHLQELLETTGCFVTLPKPTDATDNVTVHGPQKALVEALQFVIAKANSTATADLDLTTLVANKDHEAALVLLKILATKERANVRAIETQTNAQIFFPRQNVQTAGGSNDDVTLEINAKSDQDAAAARAKLVDLVTSRGAMYYSTIVLPIELHKHPRIRNAVTKLREQPPIAVPKGGKAPVIDVLYPSVNDDHENLLVLMFDPNDKKANKKTAKAFDDRAQAVLAQASKEAADFVTETIVINPKFHRHIIGPKGATLQKIIADNNTSNVQMSVRIGSSVNRMTRAAEQDGDAAAAAAKVASRQPIEDDQVVVKGAKTEVQAAIAQIKALVEEIKHNEIMSGFTSEVPVPARFTSFIVGKNGSNIQKLLETPGIVKVEVESKPSQAAPAGKDKEQTVKVSLQGTKKAIEDVKNQILERVAQLADATVQNVSIPFEYHRYIIGQGGRFVKRLEDKYSVRIHFPKDTPAGSEEQEQEEPVREKQDLNTIVIKGGKKGVEAAKAEIIELYDYEAHHGHRAVISIPVPCIPLLIGKQGARISQLKQYTNTRIDMPARQTGDDAGRAADEDAEVTIEGSQADIKKCKAIISHLVHHFGSAAGHTGAGDWVTETLAVPRQYHRRLIGAGGQAIRELLAPINAAAAAKASSEKKASGEKAKKPADLDADTETLVRLLLSDDTGAPGSKSDSAQDSEPVYVTVNFSSSKKHKIGPDEVLIRGVNSDVVEQVRAELQKLVDELSSNVTLHIHVPKSQRPGIIGRGGSMARELQNRHSIELKIHDKVGANEKPENDTSIFDASEGPLGSVAITGAEANCRAAIADILSKLTFSSPIKVPTQKRRAAIGAGASNLRMLRDRFSVTVDLPPQRIDGGFDQSATGEETWTIKGERDNVHKAIAHLQEIIDNHTAATVLTRELTDIESKYHRHVVGRGGATVQNIRNSSGCKVDLIKGKPLIVISGASESELDEAERLIREAVDRGRDL
ncbi:hypothetical protein RI367_000874 [Sorochytrium milnesiophthora]